MRASFLRKYRHGGRGDTGLVHVAALPTDLLIFYMRTCFAMTYLERLTATGMNPECAREAVFWYMAQGDDNGLERYVTEVEEHNRHVDTLQSESRWAQCR